MLTLIIRHSDQSQYNIYFAPDRLGPLGVSSQTGGRVEAIISLLLPSLFIKPKNDGCCLIFIHSNHLSNSIKIDYNSILTKIYAKKWHPDDHIIWRKLFWVVKGPGADISLTRSRRLKMFYLFKRLLWLSTDSFQKLEEFVPPLFYSAKSLKLSAQMSMSLGLIQC